MSRELVDGADNSGPAKKPVDMRTKFGHAPTAMQSSGVAGWVKSLIAKLTGDTK